MAQHLVTVEVTPEAEWTWAEWQCLGVDFLFLRLQGLANAVERNEGFIMSLQISTPV